MRHIKFVTLGRILNFRASNEPSYLGSARARLEKSSAWGSARELNEPSLSLNLGLINFEPEPDRAWTLKNDYRGVLTIGGFWPPHPRLMQ